MEASTKQVLAKASSIRKANPDASKVDVLRQTAKALKSATRGDFIAVFTKAPHKLAERTVSRQFYVGRGTAGTGAKKKAKARKSKAKAH